MTINIKTEDQRVVNLKAKVGDSIFDVIKDNNYEILGYGKCSVYLFSNVGLLSVFI